MAPRSRETNEVTAAPPREDYNAGDDFFAADEPLPLVPDGVYEMECERADVVFFPMYKRRGLVLKMLIIDGPHQGTVVHRHLNLGASDGKIRRRSLFYKEWCRANQNIKPLRRERMSPRKFKGKCFRCVVSTVERDRRGNALDGGQKYSKISAIVELLATNERIRVN